MQDFNKTWRGLVAGLTIALAGGDVAAQAFPARTVTVLVPFAAGGPTDVIARQLSVVMGKALGQSVIVENRASAGGIVGSELVQHAAPDGYTLLMHNIGMSTAPALYRKLRFNPLTDFEHIGQIADVPMTLVGRKDLAAADFRELRAYLQQNQSKVNLAHAGMGTASHLCGLLLMSRINAALTTIPYKGAAPALTDLIGGQVDLMCDQTTTTTQVILGGRVKAYGATTRERISVLPAVPTLSEQGLEFEVAVWHGLYAPKGTPKPVIERLAKGLQDALADPAFREAMAKLGANVVAAQKATPEGLRSHLAAEIQKWKPVIEEARQFAD